MLRAGPFVAISLLLSSMPAMSQDMREPAPRTEAERVFILGQMRLFLNSTQAIASALASGDIRTVAEEAAARGRKGTPVTTSPPGLKAKETPAWTAMMSGARKGFDDLSDAAAPGTSPTVLIGMLGETLKNCVACHQSYRLTSE